MFKYVGNQQKLKRDLMSGMCKGLDRCKELSLP